MDERGSGLGHDLSPGGKLVGLLARFVENVLDRESPHSPSNLPRSSRNSGVPMWSA
jgi:hypothetical protein